MVYQIEVQQRAPEQYEIDTELMEGAAAVVLKQHDAHPDSGLSVVIAADDFVRGLNRQYRDIDAPTDVLSFPAGEPNVDSDDPPYLGDLIIAYPYTAAQAAREGQNLRESLALLVVHGTLHLLGFDHDTAAARAMMWAAQEAALRELGISLAIVPALEVSAHDDPA